MNLEGEREDSALIIGEIENLAEEIVLVETNETPQIKEIYTEASGSNPESPVPQVPSLKKVSSILPSHTSSAPIQLVN